MIGYSKAAQLGTKKESQSSKNKKANSKLDIEYQARGTFNICEPRIAENCLKVAKISSVGTPLNMTYAHRHKRGWYKVPGRQKLLGTYKQTVRACLHCHGIMEASVKITNQVFRRLRPNVS